MYRGMATTTNEETIRMHAIYAYAYKKVHADTTSLIYSKTKKREFFRQRWKTRICVFFLILKSVAFKEL